jgi:hypothetical protein
MILSLAQQYGDKCKQIILIEIKHFIHELMHFTSSMENIIVRPKVNFYILINPIYEIALNNPPQAL